MTIQTREDTLVPPYDRPNWTALAVEVDANVSGGTALASVAAPLWRTLCAAGSDSDSDIDGDSGSARERPYLRLEWPIAEGRGLVLHLHVPPGQSDHVTSVVTNIANARKAQDCQIRIRPAEPLEGISLGGPPLADDAGLARRYRACLECAADIQLAAIEAEADAVPTYRERQRIAAQLVVAGVLRVFPDRDRAASYLAFHRDWLIRYPILLGGYTRTAAAELFDLLDSQRPPATAMAAAASTHQGDGLTDIRASFSHATSFTSPDRWEAWTTAVDALASYLSARADNPAYDVDPFARGPLYPVLLRLFHAAVRQLGIDLMDEASLYHVLLATLGERDARARFCLAPHLERLPDDGPARMPPKTDGLREGEYPWRAIVAHTSPEGRAWFDTYMQSDEQVAKPLVDALYLMRRGKLREGADLLAHAERHRQQLRDSAPSVYFALGRFYHSELAYYKYRTGDLAGADAEMERAGDAAREAIAIHRFLLPIALPLSDIPLQKARIAKERRDWAEMGRLLDVMFEMEAGLRPLCVLGDGTAIDYPALEAHLRGIALPEPERKQVDEVLRLDKRLNEFRRLTSRLYVVQHLVTLTTLRAD